MDGTLDLTHDRTAKTLLGMPSIQAALDEKFNAAGFTLDFVAKEMQKVAAGDFVDAAIAAVQLRAMDMRVKMTVGYAPTKVDSTHVSAPGRAFDPQVWENVPAIETATEPKNVTVQVPARRGGKKRR